MPATCAATNSPKLWPSTNSGVTPQLVHNRHNATSSVNIAAWATSVRRSSHAALGLLGSDHIISSNGKSKLAKFAATSINASRKTGYTS
ncbi:hypothetical protein RRF57_009601 [Xylaria bambusicola]|uniref:Uncharacterized protein n=1 Tax=Xylaria bambusicola TaxID=326684 RepID=A0AAN7Z7Y9_9PEZI